MKQIYQIGFDMQGDEDLKTTLRNLIFQDDICQDLSDKERFEMMNLCEGNIGCWQEGFLDLQEFEGMDKNFLEQNQDIVTNLQSHIQELIMEEAKSKPQLAKKKSEDFPDLALVAAQQNKGSGKNILQQMEDEKLAKSIAQNNFQLGHFNIEHKKSQNYQNIGQKKVENQWANQKYDQLYDTNPNMGHQIHQLCQMFPQVEASVVKLVYLNLDQDKLLAEKYLKQNFKDQFVNQDEVMKKKIKEAEKEKKLLQKKENQQFQEEEKQDPLEPVIEYNADQYQFYREQVHRNMKLKSIFAHTASQLGHNKREQGKLNDLADSNAITLSEAIEISRKMFLDYTRTNRPQSIDLHGYFSEEAVDLVDQHILWIQKKFNSGNHNFKITRSKVYLEVITGKGLHSKGKQVLYPKILKYCKDYNFEYKELKSEGKIIIKVPPY